jgi:hypothetical protein
MVASSKIENVFVIVFCKNVELSYGSTLVFDSIRTGFPDSNIHVIDNGIFDFSIKQSIKNKVKEIDGSFYSDGKVYTHHQLLRTIISKISGSIAIVDPDIIFWDRMDTTSDSLVSGRKIPIFFDPISKCINHQRIHTSLLKISNTEIMINLIESAEKSYNESDLMSPVMLKRLDVWERFDTMSSFCSVYPDFISEFDEIELDKYDHLFCGTHLDVVKDKLCIDNSPVEWEREFSNIHKYAKNKQYDKLRGIWKIQNKFFEYYNPEIYAKK